jgi:hypothetical protein
VQSEMAGLITKLQAAQRTAITTALDKNATVDDVKPKIEAVLNVQTEIAMLRYDKGVKPIVKDIADDQKTSLNKNSSVAYRQLFGDNPDGFSSFEQRMGQSMASSFLKALGISHESPVTQKQFEEGFARLFESWNTNHSGKLSQSQIAAGLNKIMGDPMMMQFSGMMGWGGMFGQ